MILIAALTTTGCATAPPNTPGAGIGQTYTPIVDMQGVDPGRYSRDLADCRAYAGRVDNQAAALQGAIGGAILMGVLSAALGGNSRMNNQAATAGGFAGLTGNESRAFGKQERIIVNCMVGTATSKSPQGHLYLGPKATNCAEHGCFGVTKADFSAHWG